MGNKISTVFQNLDNIINGGWASPAQQNNAIANKDAHGVPLNHSYDMSGSDYGKHVIYTTDDKDKYEKKKLELQQNRYLAEKWHKANVNLSIQAYNGLSNVKLMYRDCDMMDAMPEIASVLNTYMEESCVVGSDGQMVHVHSKSNRIKSILEDLFVNRLEINITAPMIVRAMCKYGNQFMLLNVDKKLGVTGWKQLPVNNVERLENGLENGYVTQGVTNATVSDTDLSTRFLWTDFNSSSQVAFRNWQVAHFRILSNSIYLPYGVSIMQGSRRHWRLLSLMEDMMLIYRLERSVERRVYKVFVGALDDADVQAYVEEVANNFKRTPIIDPETGQIDLRKNILSVDNDAFIPVRDYNTPSPIETLPAGQNLTAIDDIKYIQNKMLAGLCVPRTFIDFEQSPGEGSNLAMMDIRFTRTVNRVQQAFLMELTKVASIHLYLMGFEDDLNNFSLSMNNPSTQAEQLEIENMGKKIDTVRNAVSDPGNGIPVMSMTRALKEVMKYSDSEIKEIWEELRLEKAVAAELEKTTQIIKKTGIFDHVDRIYGEPGADYQDEQQPEGGPDMGGGGGGGGMPPMGGGAPDLGGEPDMNSDVDNLDAMGAEGGDIQGNEGEAPLSEETPMESAKPRKPLIMENKKHGETMVERADIYDKTLMFNEEYQNILNSINNFLKD